MSVISTGPWLVCFLLPFLISDPRSSFLVLTFSGVKYKGKKTSREKAFTGLKTRLVKYSSIFSTPEGQVLESCGVELLIVPIKMCRVKKHKRLSLYWICSLFSGLYLQYVQSFSHYKAIKITSHAVWWNKRHTKENCLTRMDPGRSLLLWHSVIKKAETGLLCYWITDC